MDMKESQEQQDHPHAPLRPKGPLQSSGQESSSQPPHLHSPKNPQLWNEKKDSYKMFNRIAKRYDFLNRLLSFGLDSYWRKQMVRHATVSHLVSPSQILQVLDLATGTADVALELAKKNEIKHVVGLDLSHEMLQQALLKISHRPQGKKIRLQWGDAVKIPFPDESFHVVTLSFGIRNFPDPLESMQHIYRVLKPEGRVLIMEFSLPEFSLLKKIYLFYLRYILPFLGGIFAGDYKAYRYLNQTIETFPYGHDFVQLMKHAGFEKVTVKTLAWGITSLYIGDKNPARQKDQYH